MGNIVSKVRYDLLSVGAQWAFDRGAIRASVPAPGAGKRHYIVNINKSNIAAVVDGIKEWLTDEDSAVSIYDMSAEDTAENRPTMLAIVHLNLIERVRVVIKHIRPEYVFELGCLLGAISPRRSVAREQEAVNVQVIVERKPLRPLKGLYESDAEVPAELYDEAGRALVDAMVEVLADGLAGRDIGDIKTKEMVEMVGTFLELLAIEDIRLMRQHEGVVQAACLCLRGLAEELDPVNRLWLRMLNILEINIHDSRWDGE